MFKEWVRKDYREQPNNAALRLKTLDKVALESTMPSWKSSSSVYEKDKFPYYDICTEVHAVAASASAMKAYVIL